MRSGNSPAVWKVVALHLLGGFFIAGGFIQCVLQAYDDGLWPVPVGIVFVLSGAFLWFLGARARLELSKRRATA